MLFITKLDLIFSGFSRQSASSVLVMDFGEGIHTELSYYISDCIIINFPRSINFCFIMGIVYIDCVERSWHCKEL